MRAQPEHLRHGGSGEGEEDGYQPGRLVASDHMVRLDLVIANGRTPWHDRRRPRKRHRLERRASRGCLDVGQAEGPPLQRRSKPDRFGEAPRRMWYPSLGLPTRLRRIVVVRARAGAGRSHSLPSVRRSGRSRPESAETVSPSRERRCPSKRAHGFDRRCGRERR